MANNNEGNSPTEGPNHNRRGSITSQTFTSLFTRSNSVTAGPTAPFPNPISTGTGTTQDQRRRMSITTLGLSGTSPTQPSPFPFGARRASVSTAGSDSIDENAFDDEDGPAAKSTPSTPFPRRMSFGAQALRRSQPNGSPGTNGRAPSSLPTIPAGPRRSSSGSGSGSGPGDGGSESITPPKVQNQAQASMQSKPRTASDYSVSARPGEGGGFNWSEQLRSRAESSVSYSQRSGVSTSPPASKQMSTHDRQKSVSEMAAPPSAMPTASRTPPKPARKQPDAFQERILKGDFYMD